MNSNSNQVYTYHYDAAGRLDWIDHFNGIEIQRSAFSFQRSATGGQWLSGAKTGGT